MPHFSGAWLNNLKARSTGPAVMGERISNVAPDPKNPHAFYVGPATGGIFKASNDGVAFDPILDQSPMSSVVAQGYLQSDKSFTIWM